MVKSLPVMQETWIQFLGQEDPLQKELLPTPVFLPGEFHGQRSLTGYSPWGHKELDTTKQLTFFHSSFIGFFRQEYWSRLPFPSPVDHVLSELFTMTHSSSVALHSMAHSFIELHKPLRQDKAVIHEGNHEAEAPIVWLPDAKSWLIGKDPDDGKD